MTSTAWSDNPCHWWSLLSLLDRLFLVLFHNGTTRLVLIIVIIYSIMKRVTGTTALIPDNSSIAPDKFIDLDFPIISGFTMKGSSLSLGLSKICNISIISQNTRTRLDWHLAIKISHMKWEIDLNNKDQLLLYEWPFVIILSIRPGHEPLLLSSCGCVQANSD